MFEAKLGKLRLSFIISVYWRFVSFRLVNGHVSSTCMVARVSQRVTDSSHDGGNISAGRGHASGALRAYVDASYCLVVAWIVVVSFTFPTTSRGDEKTAQSPTRKAAAQLLDGDKETEKAAVTRLIALIQQLDAQQFAERNEATQQILTYGPRSVPMLIASLGAESREIRFRVAEILRHRFTFDEIAPHLIDATAQPYGSQALTILRDRAMLQVSEVAQLENTKRLFAFWKTDVDTLRRRVIFDLVEARGRTQVMTVVAPLIGLRDKARQFDSQLASLKTLSLPFDHRHSPGFVIAEIFARGLLVNDPRKITFAEKYVQSFESLADALRAAGDSKAVVRKEVVDRANMSDGATSFLVRALDEKSREHDGLSNRIGVDPEMLTTEFFRGLAMPDTRECYRHVGKVHIADMLLETLDKWPDAPKEGVVQNVVDCAVATIASGDKPKTLALLDALEGCAELDASELNVRDGLGQRLAKRLCLAALVAPNSRAYHPVRAICDRIVNILEAGVVADSDLFPAEFVESYLDGTEASTSELARLQVGRYENILERLQQAGVEFTQPGVRRFLARMSHALNGEPELLKKGVAEVTRVVDATQSLPEQERRDQIDQALGAN